MWRGRALLGVVGNPATGGGGVSWLLPPPLLLMGGRSADSYHPPATPGLYFMVWTSSSCVCAAYWEKLAVKCVCIHSTEGIYLFLIFICLAWKTREILDSVIWYDRSAAQKQVTPNTASVLTICLRCRTWENAGSRGVSTGTVHILYTVAVYCRYGTYILYLAMISQEMYALV